ncbi:MAG: retropepsin-like aspartic protease [Caulobacteraceae bacterium]
MTRSTGKGELYRQRVWGRSMRSMAGFAAFVAVGAALVGAALVGGGPARAACQLQQVGELPVVVTRGRILLPTSINGRPVMMIADTGAFTSLLSQDVPLELGLSAHDFATTVRVDGVGGRVNARVVTIKELRFGKFVVHDAKLMVAGRRLGPDAVVGLMGTDLFSQYDTEIDLPHGVVRLLKDSGCNDAQMPYWAKTYSEAPLEASPGLGSGFFTRLMLNGHAIEAQLDTGASITTVTPGAANAAGARPEAGAPVLQMRGVGPKAIDSEVYVFDTVGLGDETVKNVRLLTADMFRYNVEQETGTRLGRETVGDIRALIGLDFFRSHHVLISPSHHLIYFSYESGEPFVAPTRRPPAPADATPSSSAAVPAAPAPKP